MRSFLFLMTVVSVLCFASVRVEASNESSDVVWGVRLYSKNTSYLEVVIDPRPVASKLEISSFYYDVKFYGEKDKFLGEKVFSHSKSLAPRRVYRQFVPHPYSGVRSVVGGTMKYSGRSYGSFYNGWLVDRDECAEPRRPEYEGRSEYLAINWQMVEQSSDSEFDGYPYLIVTENGRRPPRGYDWQKPEDPNNFLIVPKKNLVSLSDGSVMPSSGYCWVASSDKLNYKVQLRFGY